MKIIIFSPTSTMLTMRSIETRPLGGADQALIRMIDILSKDHYVDAYIPHYDNLFTCTVRLKTLPFQDAMKLTDECDVYIHYRKAWAVPANIKAKRKIFYSQDDSDSPCFAKIPGSYFNQFDQVIVLSEYHKRRMIEVFAIPDDKFVIIGNGANPRPRCQKNPLEFVYASTPFRGLVYLAHIWREIIRKYPTAQLHIYSSMKIYDGEEHDRLYFNKIYEKIQTIPGIRYHGSVPQEEVLRALDGAAMLLYPCCFPETYCNVIMEARASSTPFITTDLGALKETGGKAGIYVSGHPKEPGYQKRFLWGVDHLIGNPSIYHRCQNDCYSIRTWNDHARDLRKVIMRWL